MTIGRTNAESGGSDNVTTISLNYAVSGITITATAGNKIRSGATDANGQVVFKHLAMGYVYTFSTPGGATASVTIDALTKSATIAMSRVTVNATEGASTVTATDGINTKTATVSGGSAVFYDLPLGETWTFSDGTKTKTATIDVDTIVSLGSISVRILGHYDYGTGTVTRGSIFEEIEDAQHKMMTPILNCVSGVTTESSYYDNGTLDFDPGKQYIINIYDGEMASMILFADSSYSYSHPSGVSGNAPTDGSTPATNTWLFEKWCKVTIPPTCTKIYLYIVED